MTKKVTLSAMLTALGTALMILGSVIEVLDLSVCAIASLIVVFVYLEIGSPYTWLVWICTSICTALLYSGSVVWVEYFLVFGIYPLLKAYFEKLPRLAWWPVKLAFINAVIWIIFAVCELLLGIPFFGEDAMIMKIAVYVLMNVAFIAYDMFITVMVRLYYGKIRHRFKKFLKFDDKKRR